MLLGFLDCIDDVDEAVSVSRGGDVVGEARAFGSVAVRSADESPSSYFSGHI